MKLMRRNHLQYKYIKMILFIYVNTTMPKLLEEFSRKIEAECWYLSTVCAMQHQHQGWVKNSFGERNCGAVTFGSTAHCVLQLLPLSYGVTMDDSSWMQQQKITLVHFLLKFCISLSCQRRKNEKKKRCQIVNTLMKYGVDWHLHVCKGIMGNSHQTRLQCENDLIRQPFQLS